jgi:predicted amidophosphoribosyltransferase
VSAAPEPPVPASRADFCPLCGAPLVANDARCPECNLALDGVGARPAAFNRRSIWIWAAALVAIYLVVLAIVVAAR